LDVGGRITAEMFKGWGGEQQKGPFGTEQKQTRPQREESTTGTTQQGAQSPFGMGWNR